jgi:adenosylmethionine-8-amino-7-oxononanoate aminotransferase
MTVIADTPGPVPGRSSNAADHLWMHFTRMGSFATNPVPIIERGEGAYLYDTKGGRYLDALSELLVVQVRNENAFRTTLQKLLDLPIVGDVRGSGYIWSVELVKDQATKEPFTSADLNGYFAASSLSVCGMPASIADPTTAATQSYSSLPR